jgi:hypothetical protein
MKWNEILEKAGAAALSFTPLRPIASTVVGAIKTAEALPGASGSKKKDFAVAVVTAAVRVANSASGARVIDADAAEAAAGHAIDAVVSATNAFHELHRLHPAA